MADILSEILKKPRGVLLGILGGGVPPGSPYPDPGFSVAFGSTGCSGSARGHAPFVPEVRTLSGVRGRAPPPREICKIGYSKMQSPAFPGP